MRRLIYDHNALSVDEVQTITQSDHQAKRLLKSIIGDDLLEAINAYTPPPPLPEASPGDSFERSFRASGTAVYLWGIRQSGKTSVVGSLLALKEVEADRRNDASTMARAEALAERFTPDTSSAFKPIAIRSQSAEADEEAVVHTEVTFVTLRHREGLVGRRQKVAIVEADLGHPMPHYLLGEAVEQVHIFCIDPTADIDRQAALIAARLAELEEAGFIAHRTLGVYILVTKVDTMSRVPEEYRADAAQTMITVRLRSLWLKVQGICYDKGIFGSTPIAFSVGDVKLQALARLTDTYSHRLRDVLTDKCRLEPTLLDRIMNFGGKPLTIFLASAFISAMGVGIYFLIDIFPLPPTAENKPYKFVPDFYAQLETIQSSTNFYTTAHDYRNLSDDLDGEHRIYFFVKDGEERQRLVPDSIYDILRTSLDSTMAAKVHTAVDRELRRSDWDNGLLRKCKDYTASLKNSKCVDASARHALEHDDKQLHTYLNIILPLVSHDPQCRSVADVERAISKAEDYLVTPYSNNISVRRDLGEIPEKAAKSCQRSLLSRQNDLLKEKQKLEDHWKWDFWNRSTRLNAIDSELHNIDSELDRLANLAHRHNIAL